MLRSNPCRLTNTQFSREEMLAIVEEAAVGLPFGRQPLHALRLFWKGVDRTPSGCPTHHYIPASWLTYACGLQAGRCTQSLAQAALQRGCYLACERCSWDEEREERGKALSPQPTTSHALQASGTYVCAHAYTSEAIRRAVEFGVRSIEHGNLLDEGTAGGWAVGWSGVQLAVVFVQALGELGGDKFCSRAGCDW